MRETSANVSIRILMALHELGPMSVNELLRIEKMKFKKPATYTAAAKLRKAGWLDVLPSSEKSQRLALTTEGIKHIELKNNKIIETDPRLIVRCDSAMNRFLYLKPMPDRQPTAAGE